MAQVEGKTVSVGDWVSFKSDIEQSAQIVAIKTDRYRGAILVLENKNGLQGEYNRGQTIIEMDASDCWL